jgi:monoterpene epsilon-lactone hydrolase
MAWRMTMNENNQPFEVAKDGTIKVPAFELPLSAALSAQSKAMLAMMLSSGMRMDMPDCLKFQSEADFKVAVDAFRSMLDSRMAPASERLLKNFPVNVAPGHIGGVRVEEFTALEGTDPRRVLINLHGGAFVCGQTYIGRIESIPVACKGKFRVVSVDYRQGYEHKFPAASEDIVAVYEELLKTYSSSQIGIYGASAGGVLAAQATAWIIERGLPIPGAIGILSAGTGGAGDSDYFAAIGVGETPPFKPLSELTGAPVGYFSNAKSNDRFVNPITAPESFRAKFPPTLLITGTRAFDFSPALATHRSLVQAGVDASLHVFDGLGHSFFYDAVSPESVDAYNTIISFFKKHLHAGH